MEIKDMKQGFVFSQLNGMSEEEWKLRDAEIKEMERRQKEREKKDRYQRSGVPQRYWAESIDTFKTDTGERKKQAEITRGFIDAVNCGAFRSLIFVGTAGTGKTHLACAMIRECGGIYRLSSQIVEEFENAKSFTAKYSESQIIESYTKFPLVVIDEIGRSDNAVKEQYMIYQIVNAIYNTRGRIVLIGNYTKKDFINYIGIAAADRLSESVLTVEFTGASYRASLRQAGIERQ